MAHRLRPARMNGERFLMRSDQIAKIITTIAGRRSVRLSSELVHSGLLRRTCTSIWRNGEKLTCGCVEAKSVNDGAVAAKKTEISNYVEQ